MSKRIAVLAVVASLAVAACDESSAGVGQRPAGASFTADAAAAADTVRITEWPVPWEGTRPRDPDVAPDGLVWFVGQAGNYVASLDPRDGEFRRFELAAGVHPHNLIVGDDGVVWYAGNLAAHIGRLDPRDGSIRVFPMPDPAAADPHTLVFGTDGRIWFTVQQGAFVGRLDTGTAHVDLVRMPRGSRPYGIVPDPAGGAWVVLFGSNRIVRLSPSLETRDYDLPAANARARRLVRADDGSIWYVDHNRGTLGRLDPASGAVREWPTPGGESSRPYAMAIDDRGRLWFVETGAEPNRLIGFDPATGAVVSNSAIPSGGGSVRHMVFDPASRSIWFGTDANTIGRVVVP